MASLATDPAALASVLLMLSHNDTNTIKQGEAQLKTFTSKESCIAALFQVCSTNAHVPSRLQGAILLKKTIAKFFKKFDAGQMAQLKAQILLLMTNEPEKTIATALAGCVAKLAKRQLSETNGQWPELFQLLGTLAQDANETKRALNFNLMSQLAENLAEKLLPYMDTIAQMLTGGCQDVSNVVKKDAMLACSTFLRVCADKDEVDKLKCVIAPMLAVMNTCLQNNDEESVCEGLEVIQECASLEKPLINEHLEVCKLFSALASSTYSHSSFLTCTQTLVPFLLAIVQSTTLENKTKSASVATILEIIDSRPKLLAKLNLVSPILNATAQIIATSEGSACGSLYTMPSAAQINDTEKDDDDDDESFNSEMEASQSAQVIINSLAISIPSKHFTEPALAIVSQCMANPDPKMRKAGSSIIGIIAEGCADTLRPLLDRIMPALLLAMRDPDLTVREVACFAMGQFSEYLQPDILHYNQAVIPTIAACLEDPAETVKNTACYVLEMFVENLQKETLRPHLPQIMQKLAVILQSTSRTSQEMALSGIGACAVAAEVDFAPYTTGMCSMLSQLILLDNPKQFSLRGRSLECLGHIAVAVQAELFSPYFEMGMNSAMQALALDDDGLKEHSYVFFANASKVMGSTDRFAPYFQAIVPKLLDVVGESELIAMTDDEAEDDDDDDEADPNAEEFGNSLYLNVEDSFINSKKAALTALGSFSEHCGVHFTMHLEPVIKAIMNPTGQGSIESEHDVIRAESIEVLSYIFDNLCKAVGMTEIAPKSYCMIELPPQISTLGRMIMLQCLATIEGDESKKPVASALDTIESMLETVGASLLMLPSENESHPTWNGPLGGVLIQYLVKLLQEKAACQIKIENPTEDEDDEDDHDQLVIDSVSDVIGRLAKSMGPGFEAYFDSMLPLLLKYCRPNRSFSDRSMAIGCFGEVVAELGPRTLKYQEQLLPIVQIGLADQMEGVRRNSAFFLNQFIESTGTSLVPYFTHILTWLHPICIRPDSKKTLDAGGADVDNALSAVARMIRVSQESIPLPQVLPVLLAALPLQSDFTEALNIFASLMALLSSNDATALSLLPQILLAFAHPLVPDSKYDDETKGTVISFLKSGMTQPNMQAAYAQLPVEVQQVLTESLTRA